jgi:hypothetical protein
MEILTIYLNNLRNEEHYKFHLDFTKLVTQYTPATLGIELKYPLYQSALDLEAKALNVVQASVLTDELLVADLGRDDIYSGLAGTIRSAVNHFDPETRAAANRLNLLFDTYGNLSIKPYDQETASIIKLVAELRNGYLPEVTKMNLSGWVNELDAKNDAFESIKQSRYTENTLKPQQSLKLARLETDKAYRALVKRIDALIEVNGETVYAGFVTELNQRIENYQLLLAQRQGRNAKEKEGEGSGEGEDLPKK